MNDSVMKTSPPPHSSPTAPLPTSRLPSSSSSTFRLPFPALLFPSSCSDHRNYLAFPQGLAPPPYTAHIGRVRVSDITPHEGVPEGAYIRAVEALSGSLTKYNAVVIELGGHDAAIVRCGLESVRMYSKAKAICSGGGSGGRAVRGKCPGVVYVYRSGRSTEGGELHPPCMSEVFKCLGKVARATLCAIARHLRLRSDVFNNLLDDAPLLCNEVSSSMLIAEYSETSESGERIIGGGRPTREVEKGLLTLIASDNPGIWVCDPNGRWFLADGDLVPGDLLLLTGRSLSHVTAGLCPAASYKNEVDDCSGTFSGGRASLAFRLIPHSCAILDCSPIAAAGHVIPQSFVPITVSQFMDVLSSEENAVSNHPGYDHGAHHHLMREPSLRSVLSDPLSGMFLEDAMVVSCGHSFGGHMLKKVIEMGRCALCDSEIEISTLVPNYALRAAAAAVKDEDERRLFHNAALRKRRKEAGEDALKRLKESGDLVAETDSARHFKGVQYPFSVNEKVVIKGNRRTPGKFVGREAVITSQCLNGWYLLRILDNSESVRLQYRSLQKITSSQGVATVQTQVQ